VQRPVLAIVVGVIVTGLLLGPFLILRARHPEPGSSTDWLGRVRKALIALILNTAGSLAAIGILALASATVAYVVGPEATTPTPTPIVTPTPTITPIPTPTPSPSLTSVTAGGPELDIENLGSVIDEWLTFTSLTGNPYLIGRTLRATDNGIPVTFTNATGFGSLVDSGHSVIIGTDAPTYSQVYIENHTGKTGKTVVTVDGVTVFTCPAASDPNHRQVFCSAP
jgi:hypothetical protein